MHNITITGFLSLGMALSALLFFPQQSGHFEGTVAAERQRSGARPSVDVYIHDSGTRGTGRLRAHYPNLIARGAVSDSTCRNDIPKLANPLYSYLAF